METINNLWWRKRYFCLHAPLPPSSTIHFYESVEVYLGLLTIATREGVELHVNMKWNCQRVISSHEEWKENDDEVNSHFSHNKLLLTGVHCAIMSFLLFPILWQCSNDITFSLRVCIWLGVGEENITQWSRVLLANFEWFFSVVADEAIGGEILFVWKFVALPGVKLFTNYFLGELSSLRLFGSEQYWHWLCLMCEDRHLTKWKLF